MSEDEQQEFKKAHLKEIADLIGDDGRWFNTEVLIAERLLSTDEKIKNEECSLAKYIQIKKGLMQDLLTGEVRVNV